MTSSSKSKLHQYSQKAPKKKYRGQAKVLNVNLTHDRERYLRNAEKLSSKDSSHYLSAIMNNGYSQRSQERKKYNKKTCQKGESLRLSTERKRKANLSISKSQNNIFDQSYYTLNKPNVQKQESYNTRIFETLRMNLSNSDLNEAVSLNYMSVSNLKPNKFKTYESNLE